MREPERSEGQWRGKTFCLLLRRLSKVSRRKGGTRKKPWRTQWIKPQIQKIKRSQPTQEAYYFLATITARMGAGKPSMVLLWSFGSR